MKPITLLKGYHYPMGEYKHIYASGGITQLSLDLSDSCNYRCDWCFNKDLIGKAEKDILTLKEKQELLIQAKEVGAKSLIIPGTGEPTLDPDFYPLIGSAYGLGLTTVVYTNLTGEVDKSDLQRLYSNGVSMGIKLDSFKLEHFINRYHTTKENYQNFLTNLNTVIEVYKNSTITEIRGNTQYEISRIVANMVLTHENKRELEDIADFCSTNNLPLFVRPVKPVSWAEKSIDLWKQLGSREGKLTPDIELVNLAKKYNTLFSPSSTPQNHCALYTFGLTVKSDGDIQICPDHYSSRGEFGNVRDRKLKEVIEELNNKRIIKSGFCVMLPDVIV